LISGRPAPARILAPCLPFFPSAAAVFPGKSIGFRSVS
jgi:hypothetical protein